MRKLDAVIAGNPGRRGIEPGAEPVVSALT
jgi:hypothetical protein